jgi:monoamine oxidase
MSYQLLIEMYLVTLFDMERRYLLRQLLWGIPAGIVLPSLLNSCKKDALIDESPFTGKVIVIGAGASGIYAAHLLMKQGVDVIILEASNRIGGRMMANTSFADFPIELGAEEIHGRRSILYDVASYISPENLVEHKGKDFYWMNNLLRDEQNLLSQSEYAGEVETMFQLIDSLGTYPEENKLLSQYLVDFPLNSILHPIVNALVANEYGSSNNRIGMLALKEAEAGYSSGDESFGLNGISYWQLFERVFSDAIGKVVLNEPVQTIDYMGTNVRVKSIHGTEYFADRVLVTIPLAILKNNSIEFLPSLPSEKIQAIQSIEMGNGIKITLKFTSPFWEQGTRSILGASIVPEYWVTNADKSSNGNYLTAFIMGESADNLALLSENAAIQELLSELSTLYPNGNVQSLYSGEFLYKNWANEPYIGGAYSYPSINSAGHRENLASSISNKLFFAGEATNYNGHLATVHGAMETGYRAAIEILNA